MIQNWKGAETVSLVEPSAVSAEGEILEDAQIDLETNTVTVDGETVPDADIVTEQFIAWDLRQSQVAIKQSGTNGGGFMGVNSAHPLENPNPFTNIVEMLSILLIPRPYALPLVKAVKNRNRASRFSWPCSSALSLHLAPLLSTGRQQRRSWPRMETLISP